MHKRASAPQSPFVEHVEPCSNVLGHVLALDTVLVETTEEISFVVVSNTVSKKCLKSTKVIC